MHEDMDVGNNDRLMATTPVNVIRAGANNHPHPMSSDDEPLRATPENRRKRSFSEPGVAPTAPPQCNVLPHVQLICRATFLIFGWNFFVFVFADMIESSWELPDGKTPVAIRRPSANPSYSAHSIQTTGGPGYLRSMASGGRINQRQHYFSQKTIIKPENCLPCGNR